MYSYFLDVAGAHEKGGQWCSIKTADTISGADDKTTMAEDPTEVCPRWHQRGCCERK